jgi:enoyl-CoA hydratase/carnithine racemase
VTLDRPDARNAINRAMWAALPAIFEELAEDRSVRVIVLRGAGDRAFSAGADIGEFRTRMISKQLAREYWHVVDAANSAVERCPKPVVAMVAGFALGAACPLVCACDVRIAGANARIGVPAARIGLTLGLNDTRRLVSVVGAAHARDALLTGRTYTAAEALQIGLVQRVVPLEKVEAETRALALRIAEQAPLALRQAKANVDLILRDPALGSVDRAEFAIEWAGSRDFVEGVEAFFEGRKPAFTGE